MKVSIDTKEDSHEEIKKVIKMLQNLVGESQEIFTNEPIKPDASKEDYSGDSGAEVPFPNILSDAPALSESPAVSPEQPEEAQAQEETFQNNAKSEPAEEISASAEDLFAELFSEEELKKMDAAKPKADEEGDEEEELPKSKEKKYGIELY